MNMGGAIFITAEMAKDFDKGIERCKNLPAQILPGGKLEDFFKPETDILSIVRHAFYREMAFYGEYAFGTEIASCMAEVHPI